MSFNSVPVCYSCFKTVKAPISCAGCGRHVCCLDCFVLYKTSSSDSESGIVARLAKRADWACSEECLECISLVKKPKTEPLFDQEEPQSDVNLEQHSTTEPTAAQNIVSSERAELNQDRCLLHNKSWKFYCLCCEKLICESCFLIGKSHVRHRIDYVEAVYLERRANTERKLVKLEELIKTLQEDAVRCRENLRSVQEMEVSVYDEIESIFLKAKQSVATLTDDMKQDLQVRLYLPIEAKKTYDTVQEMLKQLPQVDFLRQQLQIEKQCDEMFGESVPCNFEAIGCELVPPYELHTIRLDGFKTKIVWPQRKIVVCEIEWTIEMCKKDSVRVKVAPHFEEALNFPFKLIVRIPHRDLHKSIQKVFTVQGTSEELEITPNDQLELGGFIDQSELVVQIGLRPLNALTENRIMKQQIKNAKDRLGDSIIRIDTKHTHLESYLQAVAVSNQFCTMYFNVNLYRNENDDPVKHSTNLADRTGHQWRLDVYPIDRTDTNTNLKAYVTLREGSPVKCRFFVELMHSDAQKNVQKNTDYLFDSATDHHSYGWPCFIDRQRLLSDPGFYRNETLCFRFGVLPKDS